MSEFLAANPPTHQGLHHLPSYDGADLVPGFDIDTAGLSSTIHIELAKVSRTWIRLPKLLINSSLLCTVVRTRERKDSNYQGEQRVTSTYCQLPLLVLLSIYVLAAN